MRVSLKGAIFVSAVLAACFTVMSVIVTLPAPPAPTTKAFSSVYGLELYPDVRIIRTDRPQANSRQMVDRTHKGGRLPVRQALMPAQPISADALKILRDEYERRSGGYMPPFHCSIASVSGCQAL